MFRKCLKFGKVVYICKTKRNNMTTAQIQNLIADAIYNGGVDESAVKRCESALKNEKELKALVTDLVFDGLAVGKYADLFWDAYQHV